MHLSMLDGLRVCSRRRVLSAVADRGARSRPFVNTRPSIVSLRLCRREFDEDLRSINVLRFCHQSSRNRLDPPPVVETFWRRSYSIQDAVWVT
jgi:hypothetical protein